MIIIITDFFEKKFNKIWLDFKINDLIDKINLESKNFISLKVPFYKIKINTKNKSYRLIINNEDDITTILFINIFDKKDKKLWENINWDLHKKEILWFYNKNISDIEKGKFYKIEI